MRRLTARPNSSAFARLERERVHHARGLERAVERRRGLVVLERLEDREHVAQREPLVGPVAAAEPGVDDVAVAAQRVERLAPTCARIQRLSVSAKRADPPVLDRLGVLHAAVEQLAAPASGSVFSNDEAECVRGLRVRGRAPARRSRPPRSASASAAPRVAVADRRLRHRSHVVRVRDEARRLRARAPRRACDPSTRIASASRSW